MSAYLQRLFDRAMPVPPSARMPSAAPAGPSLSPVAQADQRLNVHGLIDQLGLAPSSDLPTEGLTAADIPVPEQHPLAPASEPSRDRAPSARAEVPSARADALVAAPEAAATHVHASFETAPTLPPPGVGHIEPGDLVLPEDAPSTRSDVAEPATPQLIPLPLADRSRPAQAERSAVEDLVPATLAPVVLPRPTEAEPARAEPPKAPEPALRTQPLASPLAPAAVLAPVPKPQLEPVAPPQVQPLPLRIPDPEAPAAPVVARPATAAPPLFPPQPDGVPPPRETRPVRPKPISANEASIIGPLTPRQRTHTLFGMRRR